MAKLLYIESSPRKTRSSSIAVAKTFLDEYKKANPQDEIATIDLWKKDLPHFDGDVIDAKYAILHGQPYTEAQAKAWKKVEEVIAEFKSGDKFIISLPMWNFSIPYKLKHYFDVIVQPGYTFKFTPEHGYEGLVPGKIVLLIYSRGGAYGVETGTQQLDLQTRYMETILGFIGFERFHTLLIEPTLAAGPEEKEKAVARAKEKAQYLGKQF